MKRLGARMQIALGQGFLLASVLLVAIAIGLLPDRRQAVMDGRSALCEAIALNSSVFLSRRDFKGLEATLSAVAQRNPDILSAAIRRADGRVAVEFGPHATTWQAIADDRSTDSQVQVPLRDGNEKWGTVEIRFRPLRERGIIGILRGPQVRLIGFVTATTMLIYIFYLGKMLDYMDPSKAVPGRVKTALNTLAEGMLVVDKSDRIVLANDSIAAVLGKPADKLIGVRTSKLPWRLLGGSTDVALFPWRLALLEERPQFSVMMQLTAANGDEKTFAVNCSPVLGSDGKFGGVLASFDDVTELEVQKREIIQSKAEAEAANRAKSDFLARMSHEIRSPMNAILGFTDVLRRGFDGNPSERQEYLETIHASGQHLLDLINDILDLSKVEAGRLDVEQVRCSAIQVAAEAVSMLRVRAEQKGLTFQTEFEDALPETILSDPTRLRQVLMNLVGNAIKFTDTGSVRVAVRLKNDTAEPRLVFDVIDSGVGIAPEALAKIFDPFTQADNSITRRFGGTGLGLAICKRFADLMGGELSVDSVLGVGSTFRLTVPTGPLEGVRIVDATSAVQSLREQTSETRRTVKLPPAHILVVDDGAENRKLVELVLRRAGVQVQSATNGAEAVALTTSAGAEGFDIILMDVQMPVMDGYTAVRTMRQRGVTVPIFALTAHAMKGTEEQCRQAGYSGYLPKPIDLDRLLNTLAEHLGSADRENTRGAATATVRADSALGLDRSPTHAIPMRNAQPLVSSLPCDDPEFRDIVAEFVDHLRARMAEMETAWSEKKLAELQQLAHWLKGSGGSAGFDAFTRPARELELSLKEGRTDETAAKLAELRGLVNRIVVQPARAVLCGD